MVSLKKSISLFFINCLVFICFMGLFSIANAVSCTGSQRPCCKGKKLSCCRHPGYDSNGREYSYDISSCATVTPIEPGPSIGPVKPIVKECTSGQVQYEPIEPCETRKRTCCSDGTWSDWEGKCGGSSSCGANECWNGSECEAKGEVLRNCSGNVAHATGGTQTRTATCTAGSGWRYGSWTGLCICKSNFTWHNNRCVKGGISSGWRWINSAMNPTSCSKASSASCGTCSEANGGTSCIVTLSEGGFTTHCYFDCMGT